MDVQVNWLAVLLAAAAAMAIGSVWYSKAAFGTMWAKLVKLDEKKMKTGAVKAMVTAVACALVTAFVLAHTAYLAHSFYGNSFMADAVTTAFWMWLGFQVTVMVMNGAFEQRPSKLTIINVANQLVTLLVMGAIIGAFGT